jgi:hypothetical protein
MVRAKVVQVVAGVVAEVDWTEVGETISPTEADAVSPMVAGAVRQSVRAVVTVMVYELVAEVMWATMCEATAVMVTAMVSGTKTQMLISMHGSAPAAGPVCANKLTMGTLVELRLG